MRDRDNVTNKSEKTNNVARELMCDTLSDLNLGHLPNQQNINIRNTLRKLNIYNKNKDRFPTIKQKGKWDNSGKVVPFPKKIYRYIQFEN